MIKQTNSFFVFMFLFTHTFKIYFMFSLLPPPQQFHEKTSAIGVKM